jgi:predicted transcriptional regulator
MLMTQTLLEMAKDLVLAQIEAHRLSPEEIHHVLQQTFTNLKALHSREETAGSAPDTTPERLPDPDNWRKSITKYRVACLECGQSFKQLSVRHLRDHGLDGRSYRVKYGIPRTQPLAAKVTTAKRQQIVKETRPWEKAPKFMQAQEEKQKQVEAMEAQKKRVARAKTREKV